MLNECQAAVAGSDPVVIVALAFFSLIAGLAGVRNVGRSIRRREPRYHVQFHAGIHRPRTETDDTPTPGADTHTEDTTP